MWRIICVECHSTWHKFCCSKKFWFWFLQFLYLLNCKDFSPIDPDYLDAIQAKSSRVNFMWNEFNVKSTWNFHVNSTWNSREIHIRWFCLCNLYQMQLNVDCIPINYVTNTNKEFNVLISGQIELDFDLDYWWYKFCFIINWR